MFHNDWTLSWLAQERRCELERQADQERLARRIERNPDRVGHWIAHSLDWLGWQLITIGRRKHAASQAALTAAAFQAARHTPCAR
jgi:hypothetical protein